MEHGPKTFKLDVGGRTGTVSTDRLKPAHLDIDQPVYTVQPRRRGRPPAGTRSPASALPGASAPLAPAASFEVSRQTRTRMGRLITRPRRYQCDVTFSRFYGSRVAAGAAQVF